MIFKKPWPDGQIIMHGDSGLIELVGSLFFVSGLFLAASRGAKFSILTSRPEGEFFKLVEGKEFRVLEKFVDRDGIVVCRPGFDYWKHRILFFLYYAELWFIRTLAHFWVFQTSESLESGIRSKDSYWFPFWAGSEAEVLDWRVIRPFNWILD